LHTVFRIVRHGTNICNQAENLSSIFQTIRFIESLQSVVVKN